MLRQKRKLYEVFQKINEVNLDNYLNEEDFDVESNKDIRKLHVSLSSSGLPEIEEEYPEWLVEQLINNNFIYKSETSFSWFFTDLGSEKFPSPHDLKNWLLSVKQDDEGEEEISEPENNDQDQSSEDDMEIEKLSEGVLDEEKKQSIINEFIDFSNQHLGLSDEKPNVVISDDPTEASKMFSFGKYTPSTGEIRVVGVNRNLADILRTLAHEMVHFKQHNENRLEQNSGDDGTDIENEANSEAAIIMRQFGRNNPIIFE